MPYQPTKVWPYLDFTKTKFASDRLENHILLFQALERYDTVGTQLVFTDDYQTWWGPGWEFDFGLKYTKV